MKKYTYFHYGTLLRESDFPILASDLKLGTYLFNAFIQEWFVVSIKKLNPTYKKPTRGFHPVKEEDVPKEYRMWLLVL